MYDCTIYDVLYCELGSSRLCVHFCLLCALAQTQILLRYIPILNILPVLERNTRKDQAVTKVELKTAQSGVIDERFE